MATGSGRDRVTTSTSVTAEWSDDERVLAVIGPRALWLLDAQGLLLGDLPAATWQPRGSTVAGCILRSAHDSEPDSGVKSLSAYEIILVLSHPRPRLWRATVSLPLPLSGEHGASSGVSGVSSGAASGAWGARSVRVKARGRAYLLEGRHQGSVVRSDFHPVLSLLAVAGICPSGSGSSLGFWDEGLEGEEDEEDDEEGEEAVAEVRFSPDGGSLAVVHHRGALSLMRMSAKDSELMLLPRSAGRTVGVPSGAAVEEEGSVVERGVEEWGVMKDGTEEKDGEEGMKEKGEEGTQQRKALRFRMVQGGVVDCVISVTWLSTDTVAVSHRSGRVAIATVHDLSNLTGPRLRDGCRFLIGREGPLETGLILMGRGCWRTGGGFCLLWSSWRRLWCGC
ncbi:unnamed protein product [Closterium sp. NIES-54]